jgi:hypothetical protein
MTSSIYWSKRLPKSKFSIPVVSPRCQGLEQGLLAAIFRLFLPFVQIGLHATEGGDSPERVPNSASRDKTVMGEKRKGW